MRTARSRLPSSAASTESVPGQAPPAIVTAVDNPGHPDHPPGEATLPKRTQGYWHGFLLWLRTKLMRLGGR